MRYYIYLYSKKESIWFPLSTGYYFLDDALVRQQYYEYVREIPCKIEKVRLLGAFPNKSPFMKHIQRLPD